MDAIGIADRNTLAGVVRMHSAAKGAGLRPLIGCRLDPVDAPSLLAYPLDRDGYGRLSRMLSLGKMRCAKGECDLKLSEVALHAEGIAFIAMPGEDLDAFEAALPALAAALAGDAACRGGASLSRRRSGADRAARPDGQARTGSASWPPTTSIITSAEPAAAAGRDELHPREGDAGDGGLSAQPQCRAAFEIAGRDGAIVRALAARDRGDARVRRRDPTSASTN